MVGAFVFVQVSATGSWKDASAMHKAMHAVPGVKTVHFLMGPTDALVLVEASDQQALMESVGKLRSVKGVGSTDTRMILPM